jgi:hypothetical protein
MPDEVREAIEYLLTGFLRQDPAARIVRLWLDAQRKE